MFLFITWLPKRLLQFSKQVMLVALARAVEMDELESYHQQTVGEPGQRSPSSSACPTTWCEQKQISQSSRGHLTTAGSPVGGAEDGKCRSKILEFKSSMTTCICGLETRPQWPSPRLRPMYWSLRTRQSNLTAAGDDVVHWGRPWGL